MKIASNPGDQRCSLVVGFDEDGGDKPKHKISVCIEKKGGVLNAFLLDSMGEYSEEFTDQVEAYLECSQSLSWNLFTCEVRREHSSYGCEVFALQDAVSFLQDPNSVQKMTLQKEEGENGFIVGLPPVCMIPTQSIKDLTMYKIKNPAALNQKLPEKNKTLVEYRDKYHVNVSGNEQNHYITNKTLKYMHFVMTCLKELPKEHIQSMINSSLVKGA